MWIVDFNRQSLDRVIPGIREGQLRQHFDAAVALVEVKYGRRLQPRSRSPAAARCGRGSTRCQRALPVAVRAGRRAVAGAVLEGASIEVSTALSGVPDDDLGALLTDLGGHDLQACWTPMPSATGPPTVRASSSLHRQGRGLPIAATRATTRRVEHRTDRRAADAHGLTEGNDGTVSRRLPRRQLCATRAGILKRPAVTQHAAVPVPVQVETRSPAKPTSTQEAFGRIVSGLARQPESPGTW